MKKLIALLLALCLMAMMTPALADNGDVDALMDKLDALTDGTEGTPGGDNADALLGILESFLKSEEGSGVDASALSGLLDSVLGGDSEGGLGGMLGMMGALLGGEESDAPAFTPVPADSLDRFFGSWTLSRVHMGGGDFTPEFLAMLGIDAAASMTISDGHFAATASYNGKTKSYKTHVGTALVDGALNATLGKETVVLQLTDAGELAMDAGFAAVFFTPAA